MFFDPKQWSVTNRIEADLLNSDEFLVHEFCLAYFRGQFEQWPEKINASQGWLVGGVRWQDRDTPQKDFFMHLGRIANRYKETIINCGYSILLPGAKIHPHRGYTDSVYRMHYGLLTPGGDCCLKVFNPVLKMDECRGWKDREAFLFDDTQEHSAWNRTKQPRAIVLLDIRKDALLATSRD